MEKTYTGQQIGLMKMLRTKGWSYKRIGQKMYCNRETARRYILGLHKGVGEYERRTEGQRKNI